MGTRGILGVVIDGVEKICYQQFDSYPSSLGAETLKILRKNNILKLKEKARQLALIHPENECNKKDNLKEILDCGVMIGDKNFINDSLYCEWGYIVNFDTNMLEIYRGFQKEHHNKGRYANNKPTIGLYIYYPCALIKEYSLSALPTIKNFLSDLDIQ